MSVTDAPKQVLIIDRDVAAIEPLRQRLSDTGLVVRVMADFGAALSVMGARPPHLLVLDWNGADAQGGGTLRHLREVHLPHATRIVVVSVLAEENEVVMALNFGADDYLVKPLSTVEAVARIAGLLRAADRRLGSRLLKTVDLELDAAASRLTAQGVSLHLRRSECRLLEFLMKHSGRAFSRHQLLAQVWGGDTAVDARTVDVNVQRLRRLLSARGLETCIQTVRGIGYRFAPLPPSAAAHREHS